MRREIVTTRRVFIVLALALLSVSLWIPDVPRAFGHPLGMLAAGPSITNEANTNPALLSVDLAASPVVMRLRWDRNGSCWMSSPGQMCDLRFTLNGKYYRVLHPAIAENPANGSVVIARVALAFLWLCCGALLVLMRPSPATWSFFVLSLYGWSPNNVITEIGPLWLQIAMTAFENAWEITIPFAACLFALYLMAPDPMPAWRRTAVALTCVAGAAAVALAISSTFLVATAASQSAYHLWFRYYNTLPAPAIVATLILLATYLQTERAERPRILWVLVGFALGTVFLLLTGYLSYLSYVAYSLAQAAYVVLITATTAYAVLKHRIIDVNVILSRTLVYTLLSAVVVGLFALVDLFFSRTLSESKAGLIADVVLALVLGFFMNAMHHRLDRFVDAILFRKRHIAEEHVALVAHSLRHAEHEATVTRLLVEEPARSFDLVFGALARRTDRGEFQIIFAFGELRPGGVLADTESLCTYLATERKALTLSKHFWRSEALRVHGIEPSIAVPVFSHDELQAIVFYAPHRNGTDLDGDEIALIDRVTDAAGAAYDRLEARALRGELTVLRGGPAGVSV